MLDLGHVKALILGETLLADPGRREEADGGNRKKYGAGKKPVSVPYGIYGGGDGAERKEKDSIGNFWQVFMRTGPQKSAGR